MNWNFWLWPWNWPITPKSWPEESGRALVNALLQSGVFWAVWLAWLAWRWFS
jgi:hypothetical protein